VFDWAGSQEHPARVWCEASALKQMPITSEYKRQSLKYTDTVLLSCYCIRITKLQPNVL
jgi:hypothetical protein